MATDQDIIDAVTAKLIGELYVGQRVRSTLTERVMPGTIKEVKEDSAMVLWDSDGPVGYLAGRQVDTFKWGLTSL